MMGRINEKKNQEKTLISNHNVDKGNLLNVMMANNGSYSNDRSSAAGGDIDYASDPASGGFFNSDYKKHDDLKQMLDSNKDGLKLEAMKRIIGMIAKGRDASELFPAVVKNVVSKNIEVKKLVYVYLVRYAEEQQDLALLSISTFQRALKDPNQLIRASALRVLSSIRVPVIVPIVMLAIKDSASDMSPYVRKTAAHAIPKLYSLDPTQKDELILVIEKLLSDKTTLVVGSAVMAFEEVCPERNDLIHKNFRKLCNLLVDVDEWGQVVIINMLTRYARTQFLDPHLADDSKYDDYDENKPFYDDEEENEVIDKEFKDKKIHTIDPDHRLLLRNAKPLLQSRNAAVVMGIAQLYHHLAPRMEVSIIGKSLVRLLRSHREVQSIVLNCIANISTERKGLFEPFLKSFFVLTSDPTHIKLLKLEILTNLATETSISVILREFQTYISSPDKEFVAAAIQAIGRCASNIKEVTDSCLSGLVSLLSNRDEAVVAESVVVIKKLLQSQPSRHRDIIRSMAKLVDNITVPAARASILWLLGEYSDLVPTIAPDVLRKMAKSFINEEDIVKLQILNLAVKLYLTNPNQTTLLCQYVFSLARYDQNYDIRDRSRFLRQIIFPSNADSKLAPFAKKIFLATKPAPLLQSKFKDREAFQMGSLSQYLNMRAVGYHDLPEFPEVAPDDSARNVSVPSPPSPFTEPITGVTNNKQSNKASFYSDSESSPQDDDSGKEEGEDNDSEEDEDDSDDSSSTSSSDEESDTESDEEESTTTKEKDKSKEKRIVASNSDDEESSSSSEESDSESSDDIPGSANRTSSAPKQQNKSNLDLLLDLDDIVPNTPVMTPSMGGFLTPLSPASNTNISAPKNNTIQITNPAFVSMKKTEVLNKVSGQGLVVECRFTRQPHLYSDKMTSVELTLTNHTPATCLTNISVSEKVVGSSMAFRGFGTIPSLAEGSSMLVTLGLDWNDSTQAAVLGLTWDQGSANICLRPTLGDLLTPVNISLETFITNQGLMRGMNEHSAIIKISNNQKSLSQRIFEMANVAALPHSDPHITRFAGQTVSTKSLVLITVKVTTPEATGSEIIVNCEKMVIGSMLLNELKTLLQAST